MNKIFALLGIGAGGSIIDKIGAILQIIQALMSAVTHLNEKLDAIKNAPAPAAPAAPAPAPAPVPAPVPVTPAAAAGADLNQMLAQAQALSLSF